MGASGRYKVEVCKWKGELSGKASVSEDWEAVLSDLCFFDFFDLCPSSPSRFRFFSCEDLCFLCDFSVVCDDSIVGSVICEGISIDIVELEF